MPDNSQSSTHSDMCPSTILDDTPPQDKTDAVDSSQLNNPYVLDTSDVLIDNSAALSAGLQNGKMAAVGMPPVCSYSSGDESSDEFFDADM